MRLGVVGAGYVGLVVAAAFGAAGHEVVCAEADAERREALVAGRCPVHEDGLAALLDAATAAGCLRFVAEAADAAAGAEIVLIAVGTAGGDAAASDVAAVRAVMVAALPALPRGAVVAVKSTCPPGTARELAQAAVAAGRPDVAVVSNPEFLVEGEAVRCFLAPDRVVVGGDAPATARLAALYATVTDAPVVRVDPTTAEIGKLVSNTMLAARVALMNDAAALADALGADVDGVRAIVGGDPRIGDAYLRPGPGFGGACLPKDVAALAASLTRAGLSDRLPAAVMDANTDHTARVVTRLLQVAGWAEVAARRIAVWGLAFKAGTDDLRRSPALTVVDALIGAGATVVAWDAAATAPPRPGLTQVDDPLVALDGADALLVLTGWPALLGLLPADMARRMRHRIVVDARDVLDRAAMAAAGFTIAGVGRPTLRPAEEPV